MIRASAALAAILLVTGCTEVEDVDGDVSAYSTDDANGTLAKNALEATLDGPEIEEIQSKLCVARTGRFDADTRAAIGKMYSALFVDSSIRDYDARDDIAEPRFLDEIRQEEDGCGDFKGAFEKFYFRALDVHPSRPASRSERVKQRIRRFQAELGHCVGLMEYVTGKEFDPEPTDEDSLVTGAFDARTRDAIAYTLSVVRNVDTGEPIAESAAMAGGELTAIDVRSLEHCVAHESYYR